MPRGGVGGVVGEASREGAGGGPDLLLHLILERKLSLNNLWKKIKPAT